MEIHKIILDFGIGNQIDYQKTFKIFSGTKTECDKKIIELKEKNPQEHYLIK